MNFIEKIRSHSLFRVGANYSIASTCASICTMIIGFLNMRWLGPELLGIWQSVTIINAYLPFLQLGIQSGLNLELPIMLGAKKESKALKLIATSHAFAILLAAFLFILSVIAVIVMVIKGIEMKILLAFAVVMLTAIEFCFRYHFIARYRSAGAFHYLTKIYWINCLLVLVLAFLIFKFQFYGLLLYHAVLYTVDTVMMYVWAPYRSEKPKFHKGYMPFLFKRGAFMLVVNQIKGVIESLPRLILLKIGGIITVGLFNPALSILGLMNLVPVQLTQFLQPQMGYKYGQTKKARDMWPLLKKLSYLSPICIFPFALIAWLIMPYVLEILFPKYLESLVPIRIMLMGSMFCTTYISRNFLLTIKAYKQVFTAYLIDAICFIALPVLLVNQYPDNLLISLSFGLTISYIITYLINVVIVRHTVHLQKYN